MLHTLAKDIYKRKRAFPFFRGDRSQYPKSAASECRICNEPFDDNDQKVFDHNSTKPIFFHVDSSEDSLLNL